MKKIAWLMVSLLFVHLALADVPAAPVEVPADLSQALESVVRGKLPLESVVISVSGDGRSLRTLHGDGMGVFQTTKQTMQIGLTKDQMIEMLRLFQTHRFTEMPPEYLDSWDDSGGRTAVPVYQPARTWVTLRIGKTTRTAYAKRYAEGKPAAALAALSDAILATSSTAAAKGGNADSFDDGIGKLATKELDPRTVRILLRQGPKAEPHLIMELNDGIVVVQQRTADGFAKAFRLQLSPAELGTLARLLVENKTAQLPAQLHAKTSTSLDIWVLSRERDVEGRPDTASGASANEAAQKGFETIVEALNALCLHVIRDGQRE